MKYKLSLKVVISAFVPVILSACNDLTDGLPTMVYTVGGTVSGLSDNQNVTLLNNNGDPLIISSNGTFVFKSPVASNGNYNVTIGIQPTSDPFQGCFASNNSGIIASTVKNVSVNCGQIVPIVSTLALKNQGAVFKPGGIAIDKIGNLYVSNLSGNVIQKIDSTGTATIIAGSGTAGNQDGQGINAKFSGPAAITIDTSNNLYVVDADNNSIRKIDKDGNVTTLFRNDANSAIGLANIAFDKVGNLYVPLVSKKQILKIDAGGNARIIAGSGSTGNDDSTVSAYDATFSAPVGVAIDSKGYIYVSDMGSNAIRKIDLNGGVYDPKSGYSGSVTTLAGSGTPALGENDGNGVKASFTNPFGLIIDGNDNIYVTEYRGNRIRKIDTNANVTTFAGGASASAPTDGYGPAASFKTPFSSVLDKDGKTFYVADFGNGLIRRIVPSVDR